MATSSLARLSLLALVATLGCDGIHNVGLDNGDSADTSKCCYDAVALQKVAACTAVTGACYCSPELCNSGSSCTTAADCPALGVPCQQCTDGTTACPTVTCDNGQCKATINQCPAPPPTMCTTDAQCPQLGIACHLCPDGTTPACYADKCINGACKIVPPACPVPPPPLPAPDGGPIEVDGGVGIGCAVPAICKQCADGSSSCATATIVNGMCVISFPPCPSPPPACTMDSECVAPQLCVSCPNGAPACAKAACVNGTCEVIQPSCPPPTCMTTADCPKTPPLGVPCRVCANGTTACPAEQCVNGACMIVLPSCQ